MTEFPKGSAAKLAETALNEIGYVEQPTNRTKYGAFTGFDGLPWCGSFVNWCAKEAGVKIPSVVATAQGAHKFKDLARWSDTPALGDLAFFDFPADGVEGISHVGIVVGLKDKTVITVEGNTGPTGKSQRNGGEVMLKEREFGKGKAIVGFGRPKFIKFDGDFPTIYTGSESPTKKEKKKK